MLGTVYFLKIAKISSRETQKNHQNAKISCHMVYYAACYSNGSRILFQTKLQKCSQILGAKIVNEFSLSGKWAERFVSLCYWLVFSFQVKQIKRIEWSKWRQSPTAGCLKTNSVLPYTKMQLQCVRWGLTELLQRSNLYSTSKERFLVKFARVSKLSAVSFPVGKGKALEWSWQFTDCESFLSRELSLRKQFFCLVHL